MARFSNSLPLLAPEQRLNYPKTISDIDKRGFHHAFRPSEIHDTMRPVFLASASAPYI